jgi:hypothetical protein
MKNIVAILTAIVLLSLSCVKPPFFDEYYRIMVTNYSSTEIRVLLADELTSNQYPDTTLPEQKPALKKASVGRSCYFDSRTRWQENFKKLPADTLSLYLLITKFLK